MNPADPGMTAIYLERYLNYGLTKEELQSGKPIIGVAQTGSDLSPCNRHHLELTKRVRDGVTAAGGTVFEIPVHPIQETGKRPTAMLDRNLAYLSLVETLFGYPIDGVVLNIGCDKTTPALLMAAATVNIPAIALSVGPMLNGWIDGELAGSGTIAWKARELRAAGHIDDAGFTDLVAESATSVGYCNTMGTATTMNSLAEALGMQLPGSASIPAPYRQRGQMSYQTGQRIVDMVWEDMRPADIMTRQAFENAVVVCSAIGGSTNAPIHLNAIARHLGTALDNDDWHQLGHGVPLLVNLQPAGEYLGEDYYRAGGVPAVVSELLDAGLLPHPDALTVNGHSIGENCSGCRTQRPEVIWPASDPILDSAGFINLKGNLFDSAIMKTSVISEGFRAKYLSNPQDPNAFEGRAVVFDGPEDFPRENRRSVGRHRRQLRPVHARSRSERLSGRCRGCEHAGSCLSVEARDTGTFPALVTAGSPEHRVRLQSSTLLQRPRKTAVWRCFAMATGSGLIWANAQSTCLSTILNSRTGGGNSRNPADFRFPRARPRGRNCFASARGSLPTEWS